MIEDQIRHQLPHVACFMDNLYKALGQCVIFGGALRDWIRGAPLGEENDIDIVVEASSEQLEFFLSRYETRKTKYGGFRFNLQGTMIDVWTLADTWAFQAGHVELIDMNSLLHTSYFNVDAILYYWKQPEKGLRTIMSLQDPVDILLPKSLNETRNKRKALEFIKKGYPVTSRLMKFALGKKDEN